MASETVNRQVNIFIQSGEAQKAYDTLIKKQQQLNAELAKTSDPKKIAQLNTELSRLSEPIDRASKKLKGELLPTFRDLEAATRKWLNEFKRTGDPAALQNFQKFNAALQEQKKQLSSLQDSHQNLFKDVFGGFTVSNLFLAGVSKVKEFLGGIVEETEQAELAISNLANDLENIGNIEALPTLSKQADDLAEKFSFLDNDDILKAQDKLVTFGKLTTAEIKKIIPVIIDYAAKTRQQVPDAADIFIKALQGQSRGLKLFGTDVKEANGIEKNFAVITTDLANKVRGAGEVFGGSITGKIQSFKQSIKDAQEAVGKFFKELFFPKTSLEVFDEVKKQTDNIDDQLNRLVGRYDELKSKASLNTDEQNELRGVIQKIVEIVPEAATAFDKYGEALDINKDKLKSYIKVRDDLLRQKEFKGIEETTAKIKQDIEFVKSLQKQIESGVRSETVTGGIGAVTHDVSLTTEDIKKLRSEMIAAKEQAVNLRESLKQTVGINFDNSALGDELDDFKAFLTGVAKAEQDTEKELDGDKKIKAQREKEEREKADKERQDKLQKEREAAAKKAAEDLAQLKKDLQKKDEELQLFNLNSFQKELFQLDKQYSELRVRAKGNKEQLIEIERLYQIDRGNIIDKYAKEAAEKAAKLDEEQKKRIVEIAQHVNDALKNALQDNNERDKLNIDNATIDNFFKTDSQKRKQELAAQEQLEMDALDNLLKHKIISQEQYEKDATAIHEHFAALRAQIDLDAIANYAQQALDIFTSINQIRAEKENQEVEADRRRNDAKKSNLERRLKSGLATQLQYNREVAKIDLEQSQKEREIRRKQFERDKIASIIQTTINIAQSVTKALASLPPPANFILAGLVGAAGAIQLGIITKQKAPEFAKGGKLGGRYHSEGGNPIIDGTTGHKIAEIEKGEAIVNKRAIGDNKQYTVSGTPSQITSMLNKIYGGIGWQPGGRILPTWQTMKVPPINYDIIRKSYAMGGRYATGGVVNSNETPPNSTIANDTVQQMNDVIKGLMESNDRMQNTISAMQVTLARGINAYTVLSDQEKKQKQMDAIRADATLK